MLPAIAFLRSPLARYIGVFVGIAVLAWGLYYSGYSRGVSHTKGVHAQALVLHIERAQEDARKIALQDAEVLYAGEVERERIRVIYRDREKEIEKHVPPDCNLCRLSPDGIGMLNDALSNRATNTPNSGERTRPGTGTTSPSEDRHNGGNSGLIDLRDWKIL